MDAERERLCREWIARQTANLDQLETGYLRRYDFMHPRANLLHMRDIEAQRFWIDIHRWELDQMVESGVEDYPQPTKND